MTIEEELRLAADRFREASEELEDAVNIAREVGLTKADITEASGGVVQ